MSSSGSSCFRNSNRHSACGEVAVKFLFNGFPEELEGCELSIRDLLDRAAEHDPAVIVELNGRFVYRKDFESVKIREGNRVEFIHPSFGG